MKNARRLAALLALTLLLAALSLPAWAEETDFVDYAGQLHLEMGSDTRKQEVTVKAFIDGDTTHFLVPETVDPSGVLKARYLACNTPESTGKIEEWGKKAAAFTREKLESAQSILVESDNDAWNLDSTSTRCLVWVWYQPPGQTEYRNLNVELLQEGLAIANSSAQNRYGDTCMAAIAQARAFKKHVYSGEKDPDFYYGDAIELTLRELRLHPQAYDGKKVAFSGIITLNHSNSVFIESYDEETGLYFGITAYYGFNMNGAGLDVLSVGNEARIVGTMQYYENGHTWQVSGLSYRMMKPDDPGNIRTLSTGHSASWLETTPQALRGQITLETEENGPETYDAAWLIQDTTVTVKNLTVAGDAGAEEPLRSLVCNPGTEEEIRLYLSFAAEEDALRALPGSTVDVRGVVEYGDIPCVHVYTQDGLTVHQK